MQVHAVLDVQYIYYKYIKKKKPLWRACKKGQYMWELKKGMDCEAMHAFQWIK
jgi:hypothetical protein